MSPRKPDFFIVGAPKCGTTAMYEYLRRHPEIHMSPVKEPHYFATDLYRRNFVASETEYLSLFSGAQGKRLVGEASATYLYSKVAAHRIHEFSPSAKIIIMLRNPVEVMYSLHAQRLYNSTESEKSFTQALQTEDRRPSNAPVPRASFPYYRDAVRYTEQVKRYVETFGRDAVHIIIYDDLKKDPADTYRKLLSFLDVDESFKLEFLVSNPGKRVRSAMLNSMLRDPPVLVQYVGAMLPSLINRSISRTLRRLNTSYRKRAALDSTWEDKLHAELRPEIENLSRLLGRDLTHWVR